MSLADVTRIKPLQPHDGLCRYDEPDVWFNDRTRAAAICANCPVAAACGKAALALGASDGIWAGVALPGIRAAEPLAEARERLRVAVETFSRQHPAQRRRAFRIREALAHAASREQARQLIDEAIRYATEQQAQALNGLRQAVDAGDRPPPLFRRAGMMIREAVHYAAEQEPASA